MRICSTSEVYHQYEGGYAVRARHMSKDVQHELVLHIFIHIDDMPCSFNEKLEKNQPDQFLIFRYLIERISVCS